MSQEEIDAILRMNSEPVAATPDALDTMELDALGEVGNISMGTAATTLAQLVNQRVNITTPRVRILTPSELFATFETPYVALAVDYTEGLEGFNLLVMKLDDASIILDLLMGGKGDKRTQELDELHLSAVSEVMNQMTATAATSMCSLFSRRVNISPPRVLLLDTMPLNEDIYRELGEDPLVVVSFKMEIGDLINSEIVQIMPLVNAKQQVSYLMGGGAEVAVSEPVVAEPVRETARPAVAATRKEEVRVQRVEFSPLTPVQPANGSNIELILDVPLQVSVVLGKSKRSIKDILTFGVGSVVELDRVVEDHVDVLVNGTLIAKGEIVVVNENFGIKLTSVLSQTERLKELAIGR